MKGIALTDILLVLIFLTITVTACSVGMGERLERGYTAQLKQTNPHPPPVPSNVAPPSPGH